MTKKAYKTRSGVIVISDGSSKMNAGFIFKSISGKILFDPAQELFTSEDLRIISLVLDNEQKEVDKLNLLDDTM